MSVFGVFLVHIFPHLDWIWRFRSLYSARKRWWRPEKLRIRIFFTQWQLLVKPPQGSCFWYMSKSVALGSSYSVSTHILTRSRDLHQGTSVNSYLKFLINPLSQIWKLELFKLEVKSLCNMSQFHSQQEKSSSRRLFSKNLS